MTQANFRRHREENKNNRTSEKKPNFSSSSAQYFGYLLFALPSSNLSLSRQDSFQLSYLSGVFSQSLTCHLNSGSPEITNKGLSVDEIAQAF